MLYGCESWNLTKAVVKKIDGTESEMLATINEENDRRRSKIIYKISDNLH